MKTFKTRLDGNNIVLDVPKELDIKVGEEYIVLVGDDNSITYVPCEAHGIKDSIKARSNDKEIEYSEQIWKDL